MNDSKTPIYAHDLGLAEASDERLATLEEYMMGDRCVDSVFEAIGPGGVIVLAEGEFEVDADLDPRVGNTRPCDCGSGHSWVDCNEQSQYCG